MLPPVASESAVSGANGPLAGWSAPASGPFAPDTALSLATGGNTVYYSTYDGCPGDEFPSTCRVRALTAGGEHRPNANWLKWSFSDPAEAIVSNIARAGGYLYWVDAGGRLVRSRDWADPHERTTVATLRDPAATALVAADASYVYWVENLSLIHI